MTVSRGSATLHCSSVVFSVLLRPHWRVDILVEIKRVFNLKPSVDSTVQRRSYGSSTAVWSPPLKDSLALPKIHVLPSFLV